MLYAGVFSLDLTCSKRCCLTGVSVGDGDPCGSDTVVTEGAVVAI